MECRIYLYDVISARARLETTPFSISCISFCVIRPRKRCMRLLSIVKILFQLNHRRLLKGCIVGYQNVCGLVSLFLGAGSHCRHDKGRRIAVSYIVLQNHHRAGAALFGADVRLHICIVNVPSEVFPVFWYDSDQTSYPSICSKSRPFITGGSCRKKEYADKGESINVLQEGSENGWSHCRSPESASCGGRRCCPCPSVHFW